MDRLGVEGNDGYRLYLDRTLIVDNWKKQSYGARLADVTLAAGTRHDLRLEYFESPGNARLKLVWDAGGDDYVDLTGQPLFPFGFGLSYTAFEYSNLAVEPAEIPATGKAAVRCTVTNTGRRSGDEIAQLYIRDVLASVARPVMELAGFQRVHLDPGQAVTVAFELTREHLRMLDRDMKWVVEAAPFRVMVGSSSKDIHLRGQLMVR
jgi:hypothetical protein